MVAAGLVVTSPAEAQTQTTSPPITVPSGRDVVGGAGNSGGEISAVVTNNPSTGGSSGVTPVATGGGQSSGSGGGNSSGSSGGTSSSTVEGGSGTSVPNPNEGYDPLFFVRRGDATFSGEGCGGGANPNGGNCVVDEVPATPATATPSVPGGSASPAGGGPVAPRPPTRDELIAAARRPLPLPGVHTSPPPGFDQLVNLPTWLWVDNWAPMIGTASSPALTVTVTARPRNVYWRMGDGTPDEVCGQGTPWDPALREEQQSSDCTHTYKRSSARQPGQRYSAVASMTWEVTWTATNGESGSLGPAVRNQTFQMRVTEGQAVITSSGG